LYWNIFRGPLEIAMGIFGGLIVGSILWYFPWKRAVSFFLVQKFEVACVEITTSN